MPDTNTKKTYNGHELLMIGGVGGPEVFGGEPTKNKLIIERLRSEGFKVRVVDIHGARRHPWRLFPLIPNLLVRPHTTTIISTAYANIEWLVKILWRFNRRRPVYLWVIGGLLPQRVANGRFKRKYFDWFRHIFAEGEKMRREFADQGINRVKVVRNFKRVDYMPEQSAAHGSAGQPIRFVFLSRIIAEKGVDNIIAATETLNREGLKGRFLVDFYGEKDHNFPAFNEAVAKNENLRYKGKLNLYSKKGYDALAGYDAMLFPSRWVGEGYPGVIADALVAGLPVIASDWSLNPELVTPDRGILVPTNDADALAEAMRNVILSPQQLVPLAEGARRAAPECDFRNVITLEILAILANN